MSLRRAASDEPAERDTSRDQQQSATDDQREIQPCERQKPVSRLSLGRRSAMDFAAGHLFPRAADRPRNLTGRHQFPRGADRLDDRASLAPVTVDWGLLRERRWSQPQHGKRGQGGNSS